MRKFVAYVAPMAFFLVLLALSAALKKTGESFWLRSPEYWIFPVQTLVCGALIFWYRSDYEFATPRKALIAIAVGVAVFGIWISPQVLFNVAPRLLGFDPTVFAAQPGPYWTTVILRFARLVIVVPLVEEIFWRGFLLRYLIDENFDRVRIGAFSWFSFAAVTIAFMLTHSTPDWPAALVCGAAYNCVAYFTKSLASCVVAHAVTNLLLGLWIMQTGQWGFW